MDFCAKRANVSAQNIMHVNSTDDCLGWRALLPQDILAMFWKTCISASLLRRGKRKYMLSNPCDGCLEVYFQQRANVQVFTIVLVFLYTPVSELLPLS
jgi:hypothetical protein